MPTRWLPHPYMFPTHPTLGHCASHIPPTFTPPTHPPPTLRAGSFDRFLNVQITLVIFLQIAMALFLSIASYIWKVTEGQKHYYLALTVNVQVGRQAMVLGGGCAVIVVGLVWTCCVWGAGHGYGENAAAGSGGVVLLGDISLACSSLSLRQHQAQARHDVQCGWVCSQWSRIKCWVLALSANPTHQPGPPTHQLPSCCCNTPPPCQGVYSSWVAQICINFLTFWILLSYLVPISLFVTMEIVKFWQVGRGGR